MNTEVNIAVHGPTVFRAAVFRLLALLETGAYHHYAEAQTYMPQIVYDPATLQAGDPFGALARADGVFALDGSDFECFQWVFLHELGHNVAIAQGLGPGELVANKYADEVIMLLGSQR
jgi:hypothetical protein